MGPIGHMGLMSLRSLDAKLFSFLWNVTSNSKSNQNYSLLITHY